MNSFYETLFVDNVASAQLINATTTERTAFVDMSLIHSIAFFLEQTATSVQDLENVALVQATDSSGTGKKAITNATLADAAFVNATAGQRFVLEADAVAMDHENGFDFIALEASASATSTTLFIDCTAIGYPRYAHEELNVGTPSTDRVKVPAGGTAGS